MKKEESIRPWFNIKQLVLFVLAFVTTVSGYKTKCEESPFTVSSVARPRCCCFLTRWGLQVQTNIWRERRTEAENQTTSPTYKPNSNSSNTLPLGQTGSHLLGTGQHPLLKRQPWDMPCWTRQTLEQSVHMGHTCQRKNEQKNTQLDSYVNKSIINPFWLTDSVSR